ncbi:MAG: 3-dehydroquinate synthase [Gemmatimonadetes bacterium]|nr:3-dehydroquinate synthase [Gemmatimonadota bacterium]
MPRPAEALDLHGSRIVVGAALADDGAQRIRDAIRGTRAAIITDTNVHDLHALALARTLDVASADVFTVPAGEASKTRETWATLTDQLLARGFGRDSTIIALGGGVVGDLAGFVAATYMRGVPFIQVPTSLLAMIDAAIGGKTGVDTPAGKNLVGAFHQPVLVCIDPATLATLPDQHVRNGLAEAIKHGAITSEDEFAWIEQATGAVAARTASSDTVHELVSRNVRMKAAVVALDEREADARKMLNFGHTVGHAIEAACRYALLHGDCVAIGMVVEARIAVDLGIAAADFEARLRAAIATAGLPTDARAAGLRLDAVLDAMRADKKARDGAIEFSLCAGVGRPHGSGSGFGTPVPAEVINRALGRVL